MKAGDHLLLITGLLILVIFIAGCAGKQQQLEQQQRLEKQQQFGCDGICDSFEQQHPDSSCYNTDCLGTQEGQQQEKQPIMGQGQIQPQLGEATISVKETGSKYKTTSSKPAGWFTTGQNADILLSGIDFNNAGGPLLFNHQGAIASDGTHLLLADRNNNRILIWNKLPTSNTPPDLVLGQKDFYANNPGKGLDQLNWPVSIATDGKHIIATDTYNDRILIWNSFPSKNGQPADIEIKDAGGGQGDRSNAKRRVGWPWAAWTDGEKLIVTSTATASVLIWNSFPTQNDQPADVVLYANEKFGTPRSIGSNGKNLMIGDHNAKVTNGKGNFFWKTFPTADDQLYNFFMATPEKIAAPPGSQTIPGEIFWGGTFTDGGKFMVLAPNLNIWDSFPQSENDAPDLIVGSRSGTQITRGYSFMSGDGSSIAYAGGKLYISLTNGNKIVAYNSMPTNAEQMPDFAIGSPDTNTNTLETNFIMSNPIPATDGKSLFVSSDFDRKLYVWKNLPDESNAHPDIVYSLPDGAWDNELFKNYLALAGKKTAYVWTKLPTDGENPEKTYKDSIGSAKFEELQGVAMDEKYFYLADNIANKIYIWEGLPSENSNPKFVLATDMPGRLSSNGKYLAVASTLSGRGGSIKIYKISELSSSAEPIVLGNGMFNLPQGVLIYENSLFVADTNYNRVLAWKDIDDAIAGKDAGTILGAESAADINPEIGRNKLFWPAGLAFDGSYLWVGEFKFSERLLRFSVR